jgi:hypothetical protein
MLQLILYSESKREEMKDPRIGLAEKVRFDQIIDTWIQPDGGTLL